MPQIYDMGLTALLPLQRKACWGFFRPKNPTASAGFEPANLGIKGQHATPRPPKPLWIRYIINIEVQLLVIYIFWIWLMYGRWSKLKKTSKSCIYLVLWDSELSIWYSQQNIIFQKLDFLPSHVKMQWGTYSFLSLWEGAVLYHWTSFPPEERNRFHFWNFVFCL